MIALNSIMESSRSIRNQIGRNFENVHSFPSFPFFFFPSISRFHKKKEKHAHSSRNNQAVRAEVGKNEKFMKRKAFKTRDTVGNGDGEGGGVGERGEGNGRSTPGFEKIQSSLCSGPRMRRRRTNYFYPPSKPSH